MASGNFSFALPNASVVLEAFDRIGKRPTELDRHMFDSARASLNLEFVDFENSTINFWKVVSGSITLVVGQPTYTLPANLVTVEEVYYSQINGIGAGINSDRILVSMTRTDYANIVNKNQTGVPTRFWFQMLTPPQLTVWETPAAGQASPNYQINYYGLQQMQDANLPSGETPDVPRRALDCLCARMAMRLAEKFAPERYAEKKAIAEDAWQKLQRRDQEPGSIIIRPDVSGYARMR